MPLSQTQPSISGTFRAASLTFHQETRNQLQEKHDVPARRSWRKRHLAIDEKHQVLACVLTTPDIGDPTTVPDLLGQITTPFETFMADGAYDGEPVSLAVLEKQPDAQVVISLHKPVVTSAAGYRETAIFEHRAGGANHLAAETGVLSKPLGFDLLYIYTNELNLVETVENAKRYPRAEPG